MKISIVSDEISADFETAVELGTSWGVHHFELRGVGENRVPFLSDYQKTKVYEVLARYNAHIVALSPGLFKFPYISPNRPRFSVNTIDAELFGNWKTARDQIAYHLQELLPASIEYAHELGVSLILAFGFSRGGIAPGVPPDELLTIFRRAAEQVSAAGMRLAIEVENGFWADTGIRTAAIVKAVNHSALGINWDPGNAFEAEAFPFPDGYAAVRGLVQHVHFKDAERISNGTYRYVIKGDIDWEGQIQALYQDEYDGFISIETHMAPKVQSAKIVLAQLQSLILSGKER